jgi:transketolase
MRNAFIDELVTLAETFDHIALMVGDLGWSVVEPFAERFPDRFINAGIAEQNMAGMAAGMASEGYHVFTYSIANFPTFRCAEQIRNDIDYHNLPVTTVSVGGGLAYGSLGYSHHAVQDYALMRTMPNMLIAAPGDPLEVRACLRYLVNHPQPSYLRIGKAGEPVFHERVPDIQPGRWLKVRDGKAPTTTGVLSTGAALGIAIDQADDQAVFSLPLWSMKAKGAQIEQVHAFDKVTTFEDHLVDGGFGSWLMEAVRDQGDLASRIAIRALGPEVCGAVASQQALHHLGGLAR